MLDEFTKANRIDRQSPHVAPFSAHRRLQARSRSMLVDAAACFVATALGSLSPQALSLFDFPVNRPVVVNIDPASGKFTDRVLIGGLRPIAWEEDAKVAPAPVFTFAPKLQEAEAAPGAYVKAAAPARPARETAPKKEKTFETKAAEAPTQPVAASAPAVVAEQKAEDQGVLATLTPSSVSVKLVQKAWDGVKSAGGAVTSGLSWLGY